MSNMIENRPQVLLLGNGLNRGHGGKSWDELMQLIKTNPNFPKQSDCPMPLQAIIATSDHVNSELKKCRKKFYGTVTEELHRNMLNELLAVGFDAILTTNYSYELECAALGVKAISDYKLIKLTKFTAGDGGKNAERKHELHTYYNIEKGGVSNKIYHIHGESRKPDSMILGHYYYGSLLKRYFQLLEKRGNRYFDYQKKGKTFPLRSWLDAFILGDIYILGFGFDFSEFDLWWLLNRKKNEKADVGAVYFYEKPDSKTNQEKLELMRILNVNVENLGMEVGDSFDNFYQVAIEDIAAKVKKSRRNIAP